MFRVNREHIIFSYSESHTCTNKSLSCAKPCRLYHILNYVKRCKLFKSFLFFVMFDMWMIYLMIYWQNIRHQIKYLTHHVSIISNIIYISEHDHHISLYLSICVNAWKSVDAIYMAVLRIRSSYILSVIVTDMCQIYDLVYCWIIPDTGPSCSVSNTDMWSSVPEAVAGCAPWVGPDVCCSSAGRPPLPLSRWCSCQLK